MYKTLFLLLLLNYTCSYAQFGTEQIITTNVNTAFSIFSADIDGDGDKDVLSASVGDDKVAWYENTDGTGTFGAQNVIATEDGASAIYAADLDSDGDKDVLVGSRDSGRVVWYENLDGMGDFSAAQVIATDVLATYTVKASDIDGDTDLDIVTASGNNSQIVWHENTDGLGTFGPKKIIGSVISTANPIRIAVADIDGDTDSDVVAILNGLNENNQLVWYKNLDGQGNFDSAETILVSGGRASQDVIVADINGNNDLDIVVSFSLDVAVGWFENTDGSGNFGALQEIAAPSSSSRSLAAADFDGDGDLDAITASNSDNELAWYENEDGMGSFGTKQLITTTHNTSFNVTISDLNNDGRQDVIASSIGDGKITWYENLFPLSVDEYDLENISVSPVPVKDILKIECRCTIKSIQLFNMLGDLLKYEMQQDAIDMSYLSQGIYLLKVTGKNDVSVIKKIMKH